MKAVMVMFDSLNRHMLPNYGCDWVIAPNFERLGKHTTTFDQCYIGSMPCMPARREIHTGRLNFLHRGWGPLEPFDDSMPEILKLNGIKSHLITDHYHYWEDGGATYHNRYSSYEMIRGQESDLWKSIQPNTKTPDLAIQLSPLVNNMLKQNTENVKVISDESMTPQAITFNLGIEFIKEHLNQDQWFLQLETFDPHEPFLVPQRFKDLYKDYPEGQDVYWPQYGFVTEGNEVIQHSRYEYAALLSMCDHYLGKVLDLFDEHDLWKDTMLIVNTDHGFLLGEHGWWAKTVMPNYNEIAHTPLFVHDPRTNQPDTHRTSLVQTIDLAPTILDFFNLEIPKDMEGKPLKTVIQEDQKIRDAALFGFHEGHINITDGRYVYMRAPQRIDNQPNYNYTLMPCHMRARFSVQELQSLTLQEPFSFTKNVPVMKVKAPMSITNPFNFGTKLFDLETSPNQEETIDDLMIELSLVNQMIALMNQNDAPITQYERIGLKQTSMTIEELKALNAQCAQNEWIEGLDDYFFTGNTRMQLLTLLRFIPVESKEQVFNGFKGMLVNQKKDTIEVEDIIGYTKHVIPKEHQGIIIYLIGLAGRSK